MTQNQKDWKPGDPLPESTTRHSVHRRPMFSLEADGSRVHVASRMIWYASQAEDLGAWSWLR